MKLGRAFAGGADVVRTNDSRTPDGRTLDFADIINNKRRLYALVLALRNLENFTTQSKKQ